MTNDNDKKSLVVNDIPYNLKPVVKEQLTDATMKRLFGEDWKNVCVYNIESKTLVTPYYNGVKVDWNNGNAADALAMKKLFEVHYPEFEVVAQVNKQVSWADYPGWAQWTKGETRCAKNGVCVDGTLVLRNKKTGELLRLNGASWFGVCGQLPCLAASDGAAWLAIWGGTRFGEPYSDFREAFFTPFKKYAQAAKTARIANTR